MVQTTTESIDSIPPISEWDLLPMGKRNNFFREMVTVTIPNNKAAVTVSYPSPRRYYSYTRVVGELPEVLAYVSWLLSTDTVTQCYEHMALKVAEVTPTEDGVSVLLSKNLYAGD